MKKFLTIIGLLTFSFVLLWVILATYPIPQNVSYGVSFSKFHSDELGVNWKDTFDGILNDLNVRKFRLSAHWPNTEPKKGFFNFEELDYQIGEIERVGGSFILVVGRRTPGWPECHEPNWYKGLSKDEKERHLFEYIERVVNRYKNSPSLLYWQVENEPFLEIFASEHCGALDKDLLQREIDFVKSLDPSHQILITDSGELSTWIQPHDMGDVFGTSVYLYVWNNHVGPIRYPIVPSFFRVKRQLVELINSTQKNSLLIELSLEPWLLQPIVETDLDTQLDRMSLDKFDEIIDFASKTSFSEQYLWGAEWWYYLKEEHDKPEFWMRAKELF